MTEWKPIANAYVTHGGSGSGNFGHKGRPGQKGGSGEGTGTSQSIDARLQNFTAYSRKRKSWLKNLKAGSKVGEIEGGRRGVIKSLGKSPAGKRFAMVTWDDWAGGKTGKYWLESLHEVH